MEVYANIHNDKMARAMAVKVIVDHNPSADELERIVDTAQSDPELDLVGFVHRRLNSLSKNAPQPQLRRIARDFLDDLKAAGGFVSFR